MRALTFAGTATDPDDSRNSTKSWSPTDAGVSSRVLAAAKMLGMSRTTLISKMQRYGIR